jgi:hypothetical protein
VHKLNSSPSMQRRVTKRVFLSVLYPFALETAGEDVVCRVGKFLDPVLTYDGHVKVSRDRLPPNSNTDLADGVRPVRVCASDPQQAEFLFEYHRIRCTGYGGIRRTKDNFQFTVYQPNAAVEAWCEGRNVRIERDLRAELQREKELRQAAQRENDCLKAQLAGLKAQLAADPRRLNPLFEALQHESELRAADAQGMKELIQAAEKEVMKAEMAALQRDDDGLEAAAGQMRAGSTRAAPPNDVNGASEGRRIGGSET